MQLISNTSIPGLKVLCTGRDYFILAYWQSEIKAHGGRYKIFLRLGFYWSVKTDSILPWTNQNSRKKDKNIKLELWAFEIPCSVKLNKKKVL